MLVLIVRLSIRRTIIEGEDGGAEKNDGLHVIDPHWMMNAGRVQDVVIAIEMPLYKHAHCNDT